jgi:BCD family chlorophyll transporter-like MFS transporter
MVRQRLQLALLHVAVTMTAVPIQSALSRVMIKELSLPATLVAILAAFPYILSPLQVGIGSLSDRRPVLGRRRTPYIVLGLILCAAGLALSPLVAYLIGENRLAGLAAAFLVFGAWGIGFNFAAVSYFSLAAELSGEKGRSRTIAVMFFFMVVSIIVTSAVLSRMLEPYSPAVLSSAFLKIAAAALVIGALGVIRLEGASTGAAVPGERIPWGRRFAAIAENAHAIMFFFYLVFLLAAILGQDILLGPFAGIAFGMSVRESTGVTSVWGTFTLLTLVLGGILGSRVNKRLLITIGSAGAAAAFLLIIAAGLAHSRPAFYAGVSLLGLATGLGTVTNLSFMLDMTAHGRVGLFMGAWGMADAIARLVGNLLGGGVRDLVTRATGDPLMGFIAVFGLFVLMLAVSLSILPRIDVGSFRRAAAEEGVHSEA